MEISIVEEIHKANLKVFLIGMEGDLSRTPVFDSLGISKEWIESRSDISERSFIVQTSKGHINEIIPIILTGFTTRQELIDKTRKSITQISLNTEVAVHFISPELMEEYFIDFVTALTIVNSAQSEYKSEPVKVISIDSLQVILLSQEQKDITRINNQGAIGLKIGKWINETRNLINGPANFITPEYLAQFALKNCKKYNLDCEIMGKSKLKSLQFNALLSVNKGSSIEPKLIVMKYSPPTATKRVGMVGKGVTFDTGGISIKGAQNLHYMKTDMGGAALAICTTLLAAQLQLPISIISVIPCTENCVDGDSLKPGDVIKAYNGKTIEIIDTDAEGRLILADVLSYITTKYKLDIVLDLATLTGSIIRAIGTEAAGLFSNSKEVSRILRKAASKSGERIWPMPMWSSYADHLKSEIADIRNLGQSPVAGSIVAAKFLESFVQNEVPWAHLDVAGMVFGKTSFTKEKSATGYGIRLLYHFLIEMINSTE